MTTTVDPSDRALESAERLSAAADELTGADGEQPSFDSLGVDPALVKALAEQGITTAFAIQAMTVAFHHQELGVQPEAREGLSGGALRLRYFVRRMREDQVHAAGVDIQRLTQILNRHHGAFDVPARPAAADLLVPENFALLGRFPQCEIARVRLFVLVHI